MEYTCDPIRQTNQSSLRLLQILECLAKNRGALRLQEIAKLTELTQPTVLRYLYALEAANYVYQERDSSRYALTWKVCRLTQNINSYLSLRNISSPFIMDFANTFSVGACLVVEEKGECMYLDCIDIPNHPSLQKIGKRAPLHATASGKVLLSHYSPSKLNNFIEDSDLTKLTEFTITDPEKLTAELEQIREQGFATDEQECEMGLRCISMPLRDFTGDIVAAISVFGTVDEMQNSWVMENVFPILKKAANTISARLGYELPEGKNKTKDTD